MDAERLEERLKLLSNGMPSRVWTSGELETRAANGKLLFRGYASITEAPYDMGYYKETIKRGAFTTTLAQAPRVWLNLNHGDSGSGLPIAGTPNGSLKLTEDERGLLFDAEAWDDDPDATIAAKKIDRGLLDQCSFAFMVMRQDWRNDREDRDILEVNLDRGDVSMVTNGANPATTVGVTAREFCEALIEVRAGAQLSNATMNALKSILNLVDAADTGVDKALMELSDLMGVDNPDVAQDAALNRAADEPIEVASISLDTFMARAWALRQRVA